MRFLLWLIRVTLLSIMLVLAAGTAVISGFVLYLGPQLPKIDSIVDLKLQTPLKIISKDGLSLGEFGEMRREPLPYSALPPSYIKAVLAAEDDRFFTHGGVDPTGLARAASELAKTGRIRSGGSTITMQLARNFFSVLKNLLSVNSMKFFSLYNSKELYPKNKSLACMSIKFT